METFRAIAHVSQLPVVPGALYALDLDETLLKTVDGVVWDCVARYAPDVPFVQNLAKVATVVYITYRELSYYEKTRSQLRRAGFPLDGCDIHHTGNKGYRLQKILGENPDRWPRVLFADDATRHLEWVSQLVPHAETYRVCQQLHREHLKEHVAPEAPPVATRVLRPRDSSGRVTKANPNV
jgi:hypothetical protein